ncbi:inosine/xanthosine triphosphatase [Marinomonas sp. RSW2]|uniref:Inosine/xanthosine triphosphatase n=1 Tax=Marinomonas maritima TaxID=2940935 RepID=A0ABT5WFM9_9GAMM|nr:inosine/xanthosine triphosphatase [Marinomonas maritima]MDE8603179.1 inosine/xanthosine triphosphatase [Marinomonas maritima]
MVVKTGSTVIRICVGSNNPVKVGAAKQAFTLMYPNHIVHCEEIHAPSGVADQPMTEAETRLGAQNRTHYCARYYNEQQSDSDIDYFVAMEGGVDKFEEGAATFAYVAILSNKGVLMTGRSANLPLPSKVYKRLQANEELGVVMDDIFNTSNIRQKGGAIGLFTNHAATRESIYTQALVLALAPSLHPEHYSDQ